MNKFEAWLHKRLPGAFADGISSVLHGLAVFVPAKILLVSPFLGPGLSVLWASGMFIFYARREYKDYHKALLILDRKTRRAKKADALRDLFFPFLAWLLIILPQV